MAPDLLNSLTKMRILLALRLCDLNDLINMVVFRQVMDQLLIMDSNLLDHLTHALSNEMMYRSFETAGHLVRAISELRV